MKISLSNDKGKIEYCIYNTGEIRECLTEYTVTSWDLENNNLDLRKFFDYDIITNQCKKEIKTIIIDKKTIKNRSIVKSFIYNNSSYFSEYYTFNIKKLHIVDDDDMRLIPKAKTYCMQGKRNANVIDGYHYIYLGNKGNDVLIYIDKSNHLKIIEKNDILEDREVENIYFKFDYIRDSISSYVRNKSLILISYKNGNHKIINFDEVFEINELFNKIILENAASLSLSPEIVNGLSNNNWVSVINAYRFDNNMLVKMNELYNQYNNTLIELKNRGLSDRAIKYLCDKNYIKIFLENFEKIVENKEMISKEIETFNGLGDNYHKLVLKK